MSKNNATITIRDLARHLDVATSTVSRALAGDQGVGEERIAQIRQLAEKLNYRPKPLRRKLGKTLGFIIATDLAGQADDSFEYETLYQVMVAAAEANWHVHVELADRAALASGVPSFIRENRVDGVMISGFPPAEFCQRLRQMGVPALVLQDTVARTGLPSIIPDVKNTTAEMVGRLIEMGHKRVAFVSLLSSFPTVVARQEGYRQTMANAGLDTAGLEVGVIRSVLRQGQMAVRQLLTASSRPTAIVFVTDRLALGGIHELACSGLKVAEDVSVVGHDNTLLAEEFDPPLTTVDMGFVKTAETAVALLRQSVTNSETGEAKQYYVPTRVIWRGSCGPVKR